MYGLEVAAELGRSARAQRGANELADQRVTRDEPHHHEGADDEFSREVHDQRRRQRGEREDDAHHGGGADDDGAPADAVGEAGGGDR